MGSTIHHGRVFQLRDRGRAVWVNGDVADGLGLPADGPSLIRLCEALLDPRRAPRQVFKDDSRSVVTTVSLDQQDWIVKRYRGPGWKTAIYHSLRRTPAWREWAGAMQLQQARCRVSRPLALVHQTGPAGISQALILPYVEGPSLYHWLVGSSGAAADSLNARTRRRRMAQAVGGCIGQMTAAGIINRDLKPSNLIVDPLCEQGNQPPWIIDPAGLRRRRNDGQVYQMLADFLYSTEEPGGVTVREAMIGLKSLLRADPSIARGQPRRLNHVAHAVQERLSASKK